MERIGEHDFSPIDEALALKEANVLYSYYFAADRNFLGIEKSPRGPRAYESRAQMDAENAPWLKLNQEAKAYVQERIRQLPGLPQYLGTKVESLATQRGQDSRMGNTLDFLQAIGDDDSIVELGRFLFDDRNPDMEGLVFRGTMGQTNPVKIVAASALRYLLLRRPELKLKIKIGFGELPLFAQMQNWWLHSVEATPYRKKLADAGYVLPPGYPAMAELEGAKTTVAGSVSTGTARQSPSVSQPATATSEDSVHQAWLLLATAVAALVVVLALRFKKRN